jgi:hypothetical protein
MEFVGRHITFLFRLHSASEGSIASYSSIQDITSDDGLAIPIRPMKIKANVTPVLQSLIAKY